MSLRSDVWAMPMRRDIIHQVFEWQRACMRRGTSTTKSRSEVSGGGRKPRPQKGTGRSRQGSIRAPHWKGGGRAFPKRNRDFSYKLNSKVVALGIKTALSDKYHRGALIVMRDSRFEFDQPEALRERLVALGVDTQRVLFISSGDHIVDGGKEADPLHEKLLEAATHLRRLTVLTPSQASVLEIVKHHTLIVSTPALSELDEILTNVGVGAKKA